MKRLRLGLLGGTFDPIHAGHLIMAEVVWEKMRLDKVVFIPSHLPPHKSARGLTPVRNRLRMVELAVCGNPHFEVSSFEAKRAGKSYSIDTVRHFASVFPGAKLFFIIGCDALSTLHQWKDIEKIISMVDFVVVNRPGDFKSNQTIKHHSVFMPGIDISSSDIRERLRRKKSIRYLVPEDVRGYIKKKGLYKWNRIQPVK